MRVEGNSIEFPLSNVRPHLICSLCDGYFRDPCTVVECLHSFCRSCLILFFRRQGKICCPTCNTRLGPHPFDTGISTESKEVIPDHTLHQVVQKIFPEMKAKMEEEEVKFYAERGIQLKPEYLLQEEEKDRSSGKVTNGNNTPTSKRVSPFLSMW